jgi:hypothetical protein
MITEASNTRKRLQKSEQAFIAYFKMITRYHEINDYKRWILEIFTFSPLYHSYRNRIKDSVDLITNVQNGVIKMPLADVLMKLQFEEFDNIRSLHRETIKKYVLLSKV